MLFYFVHTLISSLAVQVPVKSSVKEAQAIAVSKTESETAQAAAASAQSEEDVEIVYEEVEVEGSVGDGEEEVEIIEEIVEEGEGGETKVIQQQQGGVQRTQTIITQQSGNIPEDMRAKMEAMKSEMIKQVSSGGSSSQTVRIQSSSQSSSSSVTQQSFSMKSGMISSQFESAEDGGDGEVIVQETVETIQQ